MILSPKPFKVYEINHFNISVNTFNSIPPQSFWIQAMEMFDFIHLVLSWPTYGKQNKSHKCTHQ